MIIGKNSLDLSMETLKDSRYIFVSLGEYYKFGSLTKRDFLSRKFFASAATGSIVLVSEADELMKNDPYAVPHLLNLIAVYAKLPIIVNVKQECRSLNSYSEVIVESTEMPSLEPLSAIRLRTACWETVGGLFEAKRKLLKAVDYVNNDSWRVSGILLHGPPGTGKTLLARALATRLGWNFVSKSIGELLHSYIGQSEEAINQMFAEASKAQPSIIFLDELDAIFSSSLTSSRMTAQLNYQFAEIALNGAKVIVIAATNHYERIDQKLLRIGRFEVQIKVDVPDDLERKDIIMKCLGTESLEIAEETKGMTGAEIRQFIQDRQYLFEKIEIE